MFVHFNGGASCLSWTLFLGSDGALSYLYLPILRSLEATKK